MPETTAATQTSSVPSRLRGLSPEQYDAVLLEIGQEIDEALAAGDDGRVPFLLQINEALEQGRAEAVDGIVKLMLFLAGQVALNESQATLFREQAEKIEAALDKIRAHVRDYIESSCPGQRLEGKVCKMWVQANPKDSVLITDPGAVPKQLYSYEVTVRVPVVPGAEEALAALPDVIAAFAPHGSYAEVRMEDDQPKQVLDQRRVRAHLEQYAEPWGRISAGKHLRTKPSIAETKRRSVQRIHP
jgi:hypothetical protein